MDGNTEKTNHLAGTRILVVEDDFLIALELQTIFADAGAEIVGPAHTLESALALVDKELSAAVLDVRVGKASVASVARRLSSRAVPFLFYTGQDRNDPTPSEWPTAKVIAKPTAPRILVSELAAILKSHVMG